ncbi:radical SAM/SPASM domain-containing protein [Parashewanella tropica]|uniref:radical SAM/SPASM domain-containing protein n=1 Tax=Parashewanella tropica TaxID=2547970 RepID=UPI00105A55B2|nr:SPASM domain-containing protein [Parashewanella tropica]
MQTATKQQIKSLAERVSKYDVHIDASQLVLSQYNIPVLLKNDDYLLFNSHTRALTKLTASEYQLLNDISSLSPAQIKYYFANGFMVYKNANELEQLEMQFSRIRTDDSSLPLTLAPSLGCNLACGYCFQGVEKAQDKFDAKVSQAIIDHLDVQKNHLNSLSITWYGGEPLMAKPALLKLADRMIALCDMNKINYSSSIITNGYLLTVETALELYARRCTWAQITIDGPQEIHDQMRPKLNGHGSYQKIIENIQAVVTQTPMAISTRVNVGQNNIEHCEALLHELHQLGLAETGRFSLYFAPIDASTAESGDAFNQSLSKKVFNQKILEFTRLGQKLGLIRPKSAPNSFLGMCVAAKNNGLVIAANGDLHKCWETMHDPEKKIGTIFDYNKALESRNNQLWRQWSPFDNDTCRACKILPLCGGMCSHRFVYHGEGDQQSTPCPDWKWSTAENIFSRALNAGVVKKEDWLDSQATIDTKVSGERHNTTSLKKSQQILRTKLNTLGYKDGAIIHIQSAG